MITGIEHTAIASFDPHRLADWYVSRLNLVPLLNTGKTVYLRAFNGVVLEFVYAETRPEPPLIRDAGLRHIAFSITDWTNTYEELQRKGVRFEGEPVVMPGMRLHFFRDPEGNFLHLVERDVLLA